ncbi:MAG: protein-S-isoprenylcysteine methyltransferase, partial [Cytophagales bacterium]|nr:protein-S-isoprenylcysteine methyltransferase [Cytophagales bacterium]
MQYFVLITCWGLYFFLHSFLASSNVKEYLKNSFGLSFRTQRLIYSTVSTLGLLAILFYNGALG